MSRFLVNKLELLRLHKEGKTVLEIMQIMGLKENTVRSALNNMKLTPNRSKTKVGRKISIVNSEKVATVTAMYMDGLPPKDIMEATGYARSTIVSIVDRHLTPEERKLGKSRRASATNLIMRLYDTGMTQTEIARRMNWSQGNVSLIVRQQLKRRAK